MFRRAAPIVVAVLLIAPPALGDLEPADLDPGGTFIDDDGTVHEGSIEAVAAEGITRGCNPPARDRYCPDDSVTRAQMAAFLVRARNLTATGGSDFVDTEGAFESDIDKLATAGITRGCNPPANDRYCPGAPVTRAQMAAFLVRAFGYTDTGGSNFTDTEGVFAADIDRLATAGITVGCNPPSNDRYCPSDPVTRGQMATFLTRALGLTPLVPPPREYPVPGNPAGDAPVPIEARAEDVSTPDIVIGNGTPASCTSASVVDAVAQGGVITFDCGPDPVTILMQQTAKIVNDADPDIVIDGGGLVTLSGGDDRRILYMNTCDPAQVWTTPHCDDQDHPRLTVQNINFVHGFQGGRENTDGGGAIFVRGGRFKVVNAGFYANRCTSTGPDVGGAAIRVFDQYQDRPVYVVSSTFGGPGDLANVCSNGGGISSIGVSWTILNSVFRDNRAVGNGANPAQSGTPGGGSGGAIYNDGNRMVLRVEGTLIDGNHANEGGGAIFYVSNNRSGDVVIADSILLDNPSDGFETAGYPGIFFLGRTITVTGSTLD